MKSEYIEAEISKHLEIMPDAAPVMVAEYRQLLTELNRDVEDPEMMIRPGYSLDPIGLWKLKQLLAKLPKQWGIQSAIKQAVGGGVDAYTYSVLKAIHEL